MVPLAIEKGPYLTVSKQITIQQPDEPAKVYKTSLRQILAYLGPHTWPFTVSIILSVAQDLTMLLLPVFASVAIDQMTAKNFAGMEITFLWLLLSLVANAITSWQKMWLNQRIGNEIIRTMRNDLMLKMQQQNYSWLDRHPTGDLVSRTTSDVNLLKTFMAQQIAYFTREILMVFLVFAVIFVFSVTIGLALLPFLALLFVVMFYYRRKMQPLFFASRQTFGRLTTVLQENITGIRVVRSFGRKREEIRKFDAENNTYFGQSKELVKYQSLFDPTIRGINQVAMILVIFIGGALALTPSSGLTFGDLFGLIILLNFVIEPVRFITQFLGDLSKVNGACDRVTEILNADMIIPEEPDAPDIPPIQGIVEFRNVWFQTRPGEIIAILGATGSGKSALVNLIPRLYEIDKGAILIDGVDIRSVTQKSLRRQVAVVAQESLLFSESLRNNIAFHNLSRANDDEEVRRCAKLAQIDDWIMSLEQGYDTIVGERGVTVSGGQRQRLCIARALFARPHVLILDDATSSVDVDTEFEIQKAFSEMFQGTTTFIITQRLSTVRNADRIFVMDNGKITEEGSHDELLEHTSGIYNRIYNTLRIEERSR
jgi:ATP-binding cassette subfamily B protein